MRAQVDDKMTQHENYLNERYQRYELEDSMDQLRKENEKLSKIIKDEKKLNEKLNKDVKKLKRE